MSETCNRIRPRRQKPFAEPHERRRLNPMVVAGLAADNSDLVWREDVTQSQNITLKSVAAVAKLGKGYLLFGSRKEFP
jgi:hypothetical protein